MSNQYNILQQLYSRSERVIKFNFEDLDVSGWTLHLILKDDRDDDVEPILSVSHTAGDSTLDDPENGIIYFTINSEESDIEYGLYKYQFIREIGNSTPKDLRVLIDSNVKVLSNFKGV